MNERIRELIKEADRKCSETRRVYDEILAELIVRECADVCDLLLNHKMSSEWSRATHDCSKAIKEHFGVEE